MLEGYRETLEVFASYLCADLQQLTQESYHTIERLAASATAEAETAHVAV